MNFLYNKFTNAFSHWSKKVPHIGIDIILFKLFSDIKSFFTQKENRTLGAALLLYYKTIFVLEYCFLRFFTYNILGIFIMCICSYVFYTCENSFYVFISQCLLSAYAAVLLIFYISVQFAFFQKALIDVIGVEAFNHYVGSNVGSTQAKYGIALIGAYQLLGTAGLVGKELNTHWIMERSQKLEMAAIRENASLHLEMIEKKAHLSNELFKQQLELSKQGASIYIKSCKEAGVKPSEEHIRMFYTPKDYSSLEATQLNNPYLPQIAQNYPEFSTSFKPSAGIAVDIPSVSPKIPSVVEGNLLDSVLHFTAHMGFLDIFVLLTSCFLLFYVIFLALTNSKKTAANPWSSEQTTSYTLEWVLPSPPAFHTFTQTPVIRETPSK